ncbi:Dabb family protein [Pseudonocardia xinjiangensis]|uniref:Dabb family protein n=1 Tax=Pseudonocardia xinjiangensis TaxID=75289 RepID=UPI003D90FC8D
MVLLRVREDVPTCTIEGVFGEIEALQSRIAGILSYTWGPYSSPEGLGRGYTHGFCMTFIDAEVRDAYLSDPEHGKVKSSVVSIAEGGIEGVLAFDFGS